MKTLITTAASLLITLSVISQGSCPNAFKRNNGNGTCGSMGQLRLSFPGGCPTEAPYIDSVYTDGEKSDVVFDAPDNSKCGGGNGYLSYCVTSGNMPPANIWVIYFRIASTGYTYACTVVNGNVVALPVKFASFTATVSGNAVTCKWDTEEEHNNNYFELERSFDGKTFKTAALIFSADNEKAANTYSYSDKSSALTTNAVVYYRIKQVDNDGKITFSNIIALRLTRNEMNNVQASPNPFTQRLLVGFTATEKGSAEIRVTDLSGKKISAAQTIVNKGSNSITIENLDAAPAGMYMVQVFINGMHTGNQKLLKL